MTVDFLSCSSSCCFNDDRGHGLTLLLKAVRAASAHIHILADQEALIANKLLANRAVVHILCSAADRKVSGVPQFLLIERLINDLLAGSRRLRSGFAKPYWSVAVFQRADSTGKVPVVSSKFA